MLEQKNINAMPCHMAPPWGLYLAEVHYDESRSFEQPSEQLPDGSDDERDDESE